MTVSETPTGTAGAAAAWLTWMSHSLEQVVERGVVERLGRLFNPLAVPILAVPPSIARPVGFDAVLPAHLVHQLESEELLDAAQVDSQAALQTEFPTWRRFGNPETEASVGFDMAICIGRETSTRVVGVW